MSTLDDELAKDERLWRMWCEGGVTESTPLAVDFFFYCVKEHAAQELAEALREYGLSKVKVAVRRTLLVFKGWLVTGVEEGTWSLEKLQDRTRRYCGLADALSATYDGCGAFMPDDPAAESAE
jgi:hypothetical protein